MSYLASLGKWTCKLSFEWKYFRFCSLEKQFVVIAFCSDICRDKIVHWHRCLCMRCVNFRFVVTRPCTCVLLVVHMESHTFLVSRAGWCFWRVFFLSDRVTDSLVADQFWHTTLTDFLRGTARLIGDSTTRLHGLNSFCRSDAAS